MVYYVLLMHYNQLSDFYFALEKFTIHRCCNFSLALKNLNLLRLWTLATLQQFVTDKFKIKINILSLLWEITVKSLQVQMSLYTVWWLNNPINKLDEMTQPFVKRCVWGLSLLILCCYHHLYVWIIRQSNINSSYITRLPDLPAYLSYLRWIQSKFIIVFIIIVI